MTQSTNLPGIPDGWEAVRWGAPDIGEYLLTKDSVVSAATHKWTQSTLIVRRIEPVCTWPRGVFKDGWLAKDSGGVYWYPNKPQADRSGWDDGGGDLMGTCGIVGEITFRAGLPWNECIQQVGPSVEGKEL